ncbi:MAG: potassium channel protein [Synergistaceae bacterium]|nr:potassium channel protein [Synergistaceae bacterium]
MATRFTKTVKNAKRGLNFSKNFKHRLLGSLSLFILLLVSCTLVVWWQEKNFEGSWLDSLWSVLFTLIGQGEFASSPRTLVGRLIVFLLSIFGVALFGVVFAEVLQRLINSRLKEMLGMSTCKFEGHIVICGWNGRGPHLIRQLAASGRQIAVVAEERPKDLPHDGDVFFVEGNPSDKGALLKGGVEKARAAIILWDPRFGDDDSRTILTGLAVEAIKPEVYTVMELHNPENERYARYAHVDDILFTDSLIADITGICTHYEGISSFIRDILSTSDDGHSFASYDVPAGFAGRTIGELFEYFRAQEQTLPIGVIVPPEGANVEESPASDWISRVNPPQDEKIVLPMKVVCIVKNGR